jgi:4-hydroxy-3-methylbut-2-enyl diphosphate reductase IspH
VHLEVHKFVRDGYSIILIGHKEHDEVVGTTGEAPDKIQVVGSVEEVANITAEDVEDTPDFGLNADTSYILGMAKIKGTVKALLDIDRLLVDAAVATVNQAPAK